MENQTAQFIKQELKKMAQSIDMWTEHLDWHEKHVDMSDEINRLYSARIKGRIDSLKLMRDTFNILLTKYETEV